MALKDSELARMNPDHRRPLRLRIAQFVPVTVTGFADRLSMSASSTASTFVGSTRTRPSSLVTKSRRSPG
ncbi:MAG: hypothetical protein OJF51_005138 [Nitrospira sp.]|nr:MAG: hypothetical protein OJF51_005138 [Nitrospira sp.]